MRTTAAILAVALCIISGCAKQDRLIGVWRADRAVQDNTETFILELMPDKRIDLRNTLIMPAAGSMTIHATGTYTSVSGGDSFTPSFTEVTLDAPDLQDRAQDAKDTITRRYNKEFKPAWKSDDEFSIEIGKSTITFKRQTN